MASWITPKSLEARDVLTMALGRAEGAAASILRDWGRSHSWLQRQLAGEEAEIRPLEWRWVESDLGCLWPVAAFLVVGDGKAEAFGITPDWDAMGRSWKVLPSLIHPARPMRRPL